MLFGVNFIANCTNTENTLFAKKNRSIFINFRLLSGTKAIFPSLSELLKTPIENIGALWRKNFSVNP